MKSITLDFKGFYCRGVSDLSLWGGGNAAIEMSPFEIDHLKEIRDGINDSGFGVESINGAIVDIYRVYGDDTKVYARTVVVGSVTPHTIDYYHSI